MTVDVISALHDKSLLSPRQRRSHRPPRDDAGDHSRIRPGAARRIERGGRPATTARGVLCRARGGSRRAVWAGPASSSCSMRWSATGQHSRRHSVGDRLPEVEPGLRLVVALHWFWVFRYHVREARDLLAELLALPGDLPTRLRAAALGVAARLAAWQSDYVAAILSAEQSLALYRELADLAGIADQLTTMGFGTATTDPARAHALFAESIDAYRKLGAPPPIGSALIGISMPEMQLRDVEAAKRHLEEAAAMFHAAGDESNALIADGVYGVCLRLEGDLAAARRRDLDVLARAEAMSSHMTLGLPLQALSDLALLEGDPERAAVLDSAQAQIAERLGGTPRLDLMGIPAVAERARTELGNERYEAASARGRSMPLPDVIRLARGDDAPDRAST